MNAFLRSNTKIASRVLSKLGCSATFIATKRNVSLSNQTRLMSTKFSKSHEYVKLDGDIGTVGITDHAAAALGDVVYVDLPSVGTKYGVGDSFGSVESVKAASDVYAPVSGEVVEANEELSGAPGKVNEAPFGAGWFIKLKLDAAGKDNFNKLLDEKAYRAHCDSEKH